MTTIILSVCGRGLSCEGSMIKSGDNCSERELKLARNQGARRLEEQIGLRLPCAPCFCLRPSGCPSWLAKFDKSRRPEADRPERLPPSPPRAPLSQEPIPPTPSPARKLTFDLPGFALLSPGHLGRGRCRWGSRGVRGPCYRSLGCRRLCLSRRRRWPGSGRRGPPDSRCSVRSGSGRWAPPGAADPRLEMSKRMRSRAREAERV